MERHEKDGKDKINKGHFETKHFKMLRDSPPLPQSMAAESGSGGSYIFKFIPCLFILSRGSSRVTYIKKNYTKNKTVTHTSVSSNKPL